jgi:hypothetical protein
MRSVTVTGQKWTDFDAEREWAVVPGSMKQAEIAMRY